MHRDALLLGYKFSQAPRDKALSKSFRVLRGELTKRNRAADFSQRFFRQACGAWHCSLLFCKEAIWFPAWQLADGTGSAPTKANLIWKGWNLDLCLPDCNLCTSSAEWGPHISLTWTKITGERGFPHQSSFPYFPKRKILALVKTIFYVKIQSPALLRKTVIVGQNIFAGFFNLLQQCDPWCYWLLMYIHNFTLSTIYIPFLQTLLVK